MNDRQADRQTSIHTYMQDLASLRFLSSQATEAGGGSALAVGASCSSVLPGPLSYLGFRGGLGFRV